MQVPISVGGGAGASGGAGGAGGQQANLQGQLAGMGGTADNGYMTFPGANNQGSGGGAGLFSGGFGMPNGIDPRAVEADPQGFQRWQQMAQEQERARPGSTMMSGRNSPQFGQQLGAGIARTMQGPPGMITNRNAFFAEGGEVAPPTPDGMPPMYAAAGAFINPAMRAAQFVGDKASQYGSAANAALGRMFMTPQGISQPYLENVRGPGGRFMAEQVQRGGDLIQPTFTQGIATGAAQFLDKYPKTAGALGLAGGVVNPFWQAVTGPSRGQPMGSSLADQIPRDTREELIAAGQRPVDVRMDMRTMTQQRPGQPATAIPMARPSMEPSAATAAETPAEAPATDDLGAFITEKLSAFDKRQKGTADVADAVKDVPKEKSKVDRIREARAEYEPLFKEILGDDKESAKINALLLLSEAGLKLAGTRKPTFAMALADAASGLPKGFAAITAQERELGVKSKMAALQQAISDVDAQDKYAQALKLQVLKSDYELLKEQAKQSGGITEDAGMGLRVTKNKGGSFVGTGIDPNDPSVKSAINSQFTLRDTDNPFVENRGQAPTTLVTDKTQRLELGKTLTSLENSLKTLDNLKSVYTSAYGPGAWFQDKVNNLLVPVDPTGLVRPNFDTADAASRISFGLNSILKNIASANDGGRVAVQEQEWVRETAKGVSDPTRFFADKELVAKQYGSLEATLRNARQQVLTQLGYEGNDYVMRTPNTGTKNDPFIIPSDPAQQKTMFTFLGSTVGKLQDPRAVVNVRMPNGTVQQFNPTQLRALNQ
jgi:hypothetical protein